MKHFLTLARFPTVGLFGEDKCGMENTRPAEFLTPAQAKSRRLREIGGAADDPLVRANRKAMKAAWGDTK